MANLPQHFWRQIFDRPTESLSTLVYFIYVSSGHAEVYKSSVPIIINHYVVWFEVSVDDVVLMELLDSKGYFSNVKLCFILRERRLGVAQDSFQITTRAKVNDQEELGLRLERIL